MEPILEKVTPASSHSFALKEDILPHIVIGWHFHPEYELTLIAEGYGKRVVGDHIATFEAGDLLVIGPNLPHYMRNDVDFYQENSKLRCRAIVAHFSEDFLGKSFFHQPELTQVWQLLLESHRGIHVYGEASRRIGNMVEKLVKVQGLERLLLLIQILAQIATTTERRQLASRGYTQKLAVTDSSKIGQVFTFLIDHFAEDINLSDVASSISMTPSAFCKMIKRHTGKTFSQTLNEIRIGHACRLLLEGDNSMAEVAYMSGFSSPSYFNRMFRNITHSTPLQYRNKFTIRGKNK